jgi:hypothetical protein
MTFSSKLEKKFQEVVSNHEEISELYRKLGISKNFILLPSKPEILVKVNDIQVITTSENGLVVYTVTGNKITLIPSVNLTQFEKRFFKFPQFTRTHESFIVNLNHLDYFSPVDQDKKGLFIAIKNLDFKVPVTETYQKKIKLFFREKSLNHVEPWNKQYQAIIEENIKSFDKEIRFMTPEELKKNFYYSSTKEFNVRQFIANMIWEYYNFLLIGKRDPIEGNIRTFWYYLKPTLSKAVTIDSKSQYGIMIDTFRKLIVDHKLFKYKDFGFVSDGQNDYSIGKTHPNIILAGEKTGHFKKLQRLQDEFGITIIALGGMPSILNTEYLSDDLEKVFNIKELPVHVITLVDYNPSSSIIYKTFLAQLQNEGVKNIASVQHLLTPDSFSKEELPHVTDQIAVTSPSDQTKLRKWLEAGNGVDLGDGVKQPLGIETEALVLDFSKLRLLFKGFFDSISEQLNNKYDYSDFLKYSLFN